MEPSLRAAPAKMSLALSLCAGPRRSCALRLFCCAPQRRFLFSTLRLLPHTPSHHHPPSSPFPAAKKLLHADRAARSGNAHLRDVLQILREGRAPQTTSRGGSSSRVSPRRQPSASTLPLRRARLRSRLLTLRRTRAPSSKPHQGRAADGRLWSYTIVIQEATLVYFGEHRFGAHRRGNIPVS